MTSWVIGMFPVSKLNVLYIADTLLINEEHEVFSESLQQPLSSYYCVILRWVVFVLFIVPFFDTVMTQLVIDIFHVFKLHLFLTTETHNKKGLPDISMKVK